MLTEKTCTGVILTLLIGRKFEQSSIRIDTVERVTKVPYSFIRPKVGF